MSRWFRFYDDAVNDPKLLRLPDDLYRAWTVLLCFASKNDGVLPTAEDIALALRLKTAKVSEWITKLVAGGLIDDVDGQYEPHNWNGRQYKSDVSTERVKRFRNAQRNVSETPNETPPETEQKQITEQKDISVAKTRPCGDDFENFWKAYPRRQGANPKAPAEKLFLAFVRGGVDPADIIRGARLCAAAESSKIGTEYIPQTVKWLRDRRWEDYITAEAGKTAIADDGMIEITNEDQLSAWDVYATGRGAKSFPRNSRGGWRFPSRWPPGYVPPEQDFVSPPAPLRRMDA